MPGFQEIVEWYTIYVNTEYLLLFFLIVATILTPAVIYAHQRSKIPRLKLDGFVKIDSPDSRPGSIDNQGVSGFFVKVVNVNRRSEGESGTCQGFVTVGNRPYRTVWEYDWNGYSISKEALLFVFGVDDNSKTVYFANSSKGQKVMELAKPYDDSINDNITITLQCEKGRCPKPLIKNVKNIIDTAKYA
jgi:hypothetical protein